MARSKKATPPASPQAKLAAVIKSARDAMRKDAGLNGDLDRIPQLAWLLFLKAFDGLEQNRKVTEEEFRSAIEAPYRWRDWAADPNGPTGQALLSFVNGDLLPYLRGLTGTGSHDPRDVLAAVFKETNNRMLSGYLLRDVVNKVNEINFASSDDIHTMARVYESMLREMRDAAGDSKVSGSFASSRAAYWSNSTRILLPGGRVGMGLRSSGDSSISRGPERVDSSGLSKRMDTSRAIVRPMFSTVR
jgi:type I restriction enzyme M protein